MREFPRRLKVCLLVALFLLVIYRAKTQYLTIDEAWVFQSFVNEPLSWMATVYDACNHVLHTLLTKFFRWLWGTSEFVLRLSSLVGCLVYFSGIYRLTQLAFGDGWRSLLAVAVLTTPPSVLDFMVASRGYGLALGLFIWSMYAVLSYWTRGRDVCWMFRAGVFAGLSIAANLTMVVPVAALGIVLLILTARHGGFWRVIDSYAGPGIGVAFLFLVLPLLRADRNNFYYGATTLRESLETLVSGWLVNESERWPWTWLHRSLEVIVHWIIPALFAGVLFVAAIALLRSMRKGRIPYRSLPLAVSGGTLALSVLLLVGLHHVAGVKYPFGRTGLYIFPMLLLTLLLAAHWATVAAVRRGAYAVAAVILLVQVVQSDVRFFNEWRFDAGTGKLVRRMADNRATQQAPAQADVVVSPLLKNTTKYYLLRRRIDWVNSIKELDYAAAPSADYYLLAAEHADAVDRFKLRTIFQDSVSGAILACGPAR